MATDGTESKAKGTGRQNTWADTIRSKLALLPDKPGCYLMKNSEGTIIYVGKAKVLKNRVRSYFTGSHDAKTQRLVSEIRDFEYIVTANNVEALILECNLIKQHQPRYNVLLKDDKTFPYIKITGETHPRLEVTRRVFKDKGKYFGPYPNAYAAQQTKKLLDRLYPLRKCKTLPDKVCLYYHIGQCIAPCEFEVEQHSYEELVSEITRFLNGGHHDIKSELERKMLEAAEQLEFERAKEYRDQIAAIDAVMERQEITTSDAMDRDVFGYATDKGWMCVQILYMRQGKMIERHASLFPYHGEEYNDFMTFVAQYYSENPVLPKELLLPGKPVEEGRTEGEGESRSEDEAQEGRAEVDGKNEISEVDPDKTDVRGKQAVDADNSDTSDGQEVEAESETDAGLTGESMNLVTDSIEAAEALEKWLRIKVHVPQRGRKKKIVDMACDNARVSLDEKFRLIERDQDRTTRAVEQLGEIIGTGVVRHIEAFDNSNIQGAHPVSAMVVFTDGKPDRKQYRKYKIRSVEGPDDYETMREVIRRRYERVLKENLKLPDLIVVDGGRGQISAAVDVLENELGLDVPVCGLVKDEKHRTAELMTGDPPHIVPLARDSQEFYLLQRIQEEVHRFAITFHRETRGKTVTYSMLDSIPGVGEKRKKQLLRHFGSVKKIKEAEVEHFKTLGIGEKLARTILASLRGELAAENGDASPMESGEAAPESGDSALETEEGSMKSANESGSTVTS